VSPLSAGTHSPGVFPLTEGVVSVLDNPIPSPHPDPVRSKAYLAEKLGVHLATVERAIKAGRIKAIRISERRVGIRESEIERYLAENEIRPAA
jgi:excisionase family DNA binding protein